MSLLVNINFKKFNLHGYIKRHWNKADFNIINLELSKIDWDKELLGKNIEDMRKKFINQVDKCTEEFVPKINVQK